jgi:xylulokinase
MSLLGLDVSTTGCRSVIFNEDGQIISQAYREYPEIYPRPGWVEMDPVRIWAAVREIIRESAAKAARDPVKALCASILGVAVTPLAKDGTPLYNSLTAVDGRCVKQAQELEGKLGKEGVFQATGACVSPAWSINKIMWIKENEPGIYKKAWKFVLYEDYIFYKLGLEPTISHSLAGLTMAFDSKNRRWSDTVLDAAGVDKALLSKPIPSGEVVGVIPDAVADDLGLPHGVKAVTGGFDQAMSALGGGLVRSGSSTLCFGTIECVTTAFPKFTSDPTLLKYNHPQYCHVIKDQYITIGFCFTAGALLKWYRDNIAAEEVRRAKEKNLDVFRMMIEESIDEPARTLALPHFIGAGTPSMDSRSRGAFVGMSLGTSRAEIVKCMLDSLSYETRLNIETVEAAGIPVGNLNLFGGGARNDKLPQVKADILEKEIRALAITETGALAAALLAGHAIGVYDDIETAVDRLIKPRKVFTPSGKHRDQYRALYGIYKDLYPALKGINERLASL